MAKPSLCFSVGRAAFRRGRYLPYRGGHLVAQDQLFRYRKTLLCLKRRLPATDGHKPTNRLALRPSNVLLGILLLTRGSLKAATGQTMLFDNSVRLNCSVNQPNRGRNIRVMTRDSRHGWS